MTDKLTENMPRIRIAWQSRPEARGRAYGKGEWHSESKREALAARVKQLNETYYDTEHWIEEEK